MTPVLHLPAVCSSFEAASGSGNNKTLLRCVQHPWLRSQGIAADKPLDSVVLQRMRKLSATNKLKKAALVVMAKSLSAVRCHQVLNLSSGSTACLESCQRLCVIPKAIKRLPTAWRGCRGDH